MFQIDVQRAVSDSSIPTTAKFKRWVKEVLQERMDAAELTIRIVSLDEITQLNSTYRFKNKPTNVLSFPFDMPEECDNEIPLLGDIIICADVIKQEAAAQTKKIEAHWAHMVVHGTLHLLGYDHEQNEDAEKMESEEIAILKKLGFQNPYEGVHHG